MKCIIAWANNMEIVIAWTNIVEWIDLAEKAYVKTNSVVRVNNVKNILEWTNIVKIIAVWTNKTF